jgi:hypothetical protein
MPDLSDAQQRYLEALPADSLADWGDKADGSKTRAHEHKETLTEKGLVEKRDGQYVRVGDDDGPEDDPTEDGPPSGLLRALESSGLTYTDFDDQYGYSRDQAERLLDDLREKGWPIEFDVVDDHGTRLWYISVERDKQYAAGRGDGIYRFALISDTHLGSQAEHLEELHDFYDRLVERGITTVYHAGDISDGYEVYRHHVNELKSEAIGWQRLRQYVADRYPQRDGITTHFITGNHDYRFYKRNGIHLGELLDGDREDLHWLGEMQATIVFDPGAGIDLELIHPSGGTPYTVGYRAQTLYRERPPEDRPTLAGIGHLHDKMQANAEGVEAFYTGCWQGPTPYIKRKGLPTKIGGWIVELEIADGTVRRLRTEWIGYEARGTENAYDADALEDLHADD